MDSIRLAGKRNIHPVIDYQGYFFRPQESECLHPHIQEFPARPFLTAELDKCYASLNGLGDQLKDISSRRRFRIGDKTQSPVDAIHDCRQSDNDYTKEVTGTRYRIPENSIRVPGFQWGSPKT
jgi:hypothetical protein